MSSECICFSSKCPTDHLLYSFENAILSGSRNKLLSLNANKLLLPIPFSKIGLCLYSFFLRYSTKKKNFYLVLIIMSVELKLCILNHISLNIWYTVFILSKHIRSTRTESGCHMACEYLSSLSCLIAHKGVQLCSFTKSWFCFEGVLEHALMLGGSKLHYFSHNLHYYNTFLPSLTQTARLVPGLMKARLPKNEMFIYLYYSPTDLHYLWLILCQLEALL